MLQTQEGQSENIRSFSHDLARITEVAQGQRRGPAHDAVRDARRRPARSTALLTDLEPTLPVLLANAVSVNQVVISHLAGLEQLLVIFPHVIAGGFTGTPGDGYGHVNLQLDQQRASRARKGYKPPSQWRPPSRPRPTARSSRPSAPPARRTSSAARRTRPTAGNGSPGRGLPRAATTPTSGIIDGVVDANGNPVHLGDQGNLSVLGDDSWKWLLVGPVVASTVNRSRR